MAKHSPSLFELARKGATFRYQELKAEIASLAEVFPHLHFGSAVSPAMPDAVEEPVTPRRRPRKSAADRKAVSLRTRTYRAATRKATT
jgi:hypothetical protein